MFNQKSRATMNDKDRGICFMDHTSHRCESCGRCLLPVHLGWAWGLFRPAGSAVKKKIWHEVWQSEDKLNPAWVSHCCHHWQCAWPAGNCVAELYPGLVPEPRVRGLGQAMQRQLLPTLMLHQTHKGSPQDQQQCVRAAVTLDTLHQPANSLMTNPTPAVCMEGHFRKCDLFSLVSWWVTLTARL